MASQFPPTNLVVLVVEDEPLLRLNLVDLFENEGFDVIDAKNAADAMALLEGRRDIRLVITDVQMPGAMDGLQLAAAIRDRWPPIELIIVSGHLRPSADRLPVGAHFLAKPYDPLNLMAVAHRCLAS